MNSLTRRNPNKANVNAAESMRLSCRPRVGECWMAVRRSASTADVTGLRGVEVGVTRARQRPLLASWSRGL